jgi:lipoprotein NlpD
MLQGQRWHFTGLILLFSLLSACGNQIYHYVKSGETLYSISFQYGQDYRDVAYWNGIRAPYTIYPHQKLRVYSLPPGVEPPSLPPITSLSDRESRQVTPESVPEDRQPVIHKQTQNNSKRRPSPPSIPQSAGKLTWVWPAQGKLLRTFSENDNSRKGLDIGNHSGSIVRAAASGSVVYSGSGLVRYGNLIIIKHNDSYLSAYAHNRKLLVKEGQSVNAGQPIAEMGDTGSEQVMLHFEIRFNGNPVDPLRYLPRRS